MSSSPQLDAALAVIVTTALGLLLFEGLLRAHYPWPWHWRRHHRRRSTSGRRP